MRPSQFFRVGLCAAVVAFSGQALAVNISLSGTVVKPDATPLAGVTVRLTQAGLTATTNAQGAWSLVGTVGIRGVYSAPITKAGNLHVENGRLQVRLDGHDIAGRGQYRSFANVGAQTTMMARSQVTVPDTLVYTYNQKVFLRDTVSEVNLTGIVRVYDTTPNPNITYGTLKDTRDGKQYRTITIGSQTWMAQNLNYRTDSSHCYNNDTANCAVYGRLYMWAAAMGLNDSCKKTTCFIDQVIPEMQGACPSGWHIPSDEEWSMLIDTVLVAATAGTKLKANSSLWTQNSGTDDYGFSVLPVGIRSNGGSFSNLGIYGDFWSASEDYGAFGASAFSRYFGGSSASVSYGVSFKLYGFSLRCLQNRL